MAGNWYAPLNGDNPRLANYVYSGSLGTITLTNGQALRQDFVLALATNHITLNLKDTLNHPIVGVNVYAYASINGTSFNACNGTTDGSGNCTLNVVNGTWWVGVSCGFIGSNFDALGYLCVDEQEVTISGNNGVANFIARSSLQATTTSLPNGVFNSFYSSQLQASGGQPPYSWSLTPGSAPLPPGLDISSDGTLSGTPTNSGTFYFIVRATDADSAFTNRSLGLTINPKPAFTLLNRIGNQFQLRLTGATGQNYTVQFSTNLASSNWFSLLTTNPSAASVTILDPGATNRSRFYRARLGP